MFRIAFHEPKIPPNTGNAIRMVAASGCELHLIGPLGYELSDARLRRAGLDYHDLASVTVHADTDAAWQAYSECAQPPHIYAFTSRASVGYASVSYLPGDVLLFGTETTGLPSEVLDDPRITEHVRIPMRPGVRSMNLANCAALAVYEAWRQAGFVGAEQPQTAGRAQAESGTAG